MRARKLAPAQRAWSDFWRELGQRVERALRGAYGDTVGQCLYSAAEELRYQREPAAILVQDGYMLVWPMGVRYAMLVQYSPREHTWVLDVDVPMGTDWRKTYA